MLNTLPCFEDHCCQPAISFHPLRTPLQMCLTAEMHDDWQVEFPERPGALRKFLPAVSPRWNVSLFHYRKSGAQSSGVLLGEHCWHLVLNQTHVCVDCRCAKSSCRNLISICEGLQACNCPLRMTMSSMLRCRFSAILRSPSWMEQLSRCSTCSYNDMLHNENPNKCIES